MKIAILSNITTEYCNDNFFLNIITNFELSAKCNLSYQQKDNNESLSRNNINRKSISITTLIEYGHGHFEQYIKIATFS